MVDVDSPPTQRAPLPPSKRSAIPSSDPHPLPPHRPCNVDDEAKLDSIHADSASALPLGHSEQPLEPTADADSGSGQRAADVIFGTGQHEPNFISYEDLMEFALDGPTPSHR